MTLLAASAITLAFPLAVRYLLDAAFQNHDRPLLNRIALSLLGLFALQAVLNYIQVYRLSATGERPWPGCGVSCSARCSSCRRISSPTGAPATSPPGCLDIWLLQGVMSNQLAEFARQALSLAGSVMMLFLMHWQLMLTSLAVVPIVVASGFSSAAGCSAPAPACRTRSRGHGHGGRGAGQIRTVQGFAQEGQERRRYGSLIAKPSWRPRRARVRALFFGVISSPPSAA